MKPNKQPLKKVQGLPKINPDLHIEFKLQCLKKRITMQQGAEEAIRNWLKQKDRGDE